MTEKYASWLFKINALINWTLSIRAIVDPLGMDLAIRKQAKSHA